MRERERETDIDTERETPYSYISVKYIIKPSVLINIHI